MKKKMLSIMLSVAVVFSFMPFFTIQAEAFSTGAKTLVKTKTVTIKAGKTYKSPKFKLSKKMAVQVPIKITLPGKIKDSDYGISLKYKMSLKTAKGKTKDTYKCLGEGMYNPYTDTLLYENWVYFCSKSIAKPCYSKGKYYITIKNTTKRSIKVTYSVKGYTKIANSASLAEELTADYDEIRVKAGKIGPGIPAIESVESSNADVEVGWNISHKGTLYLYPDPMTSKDCETVVTVTLKNKKNNKVVKYIIKLKIKGEPYEDD